MEQNKAFFVLKATKLSFLVRKAKLVNLLDTLVEEEALELANEQIKWMDEMIKNLEGEMEAAITPDIPF